MGMQRPIGVAKALPQKAGEVNSPYGAMRNTGIAVV